jgi:hypothetical protein
MTMKYLVGSQYDENDTHRSAFTPSQLEALLIAVGLENVNRWSDQVEDCAILPCSLNLEGYKPAQWDIEKAKPHQGGPQKCPVRAVYSVPRLLFEANMFCAIEALLPYGIPITRHTGAFWHQCLARVMKQAMDDGAEWILTIDYDTVFDRQAIETLAWLLHDNPDASAIAPIQAQRGKSTPLMTIRQPDGTNACMIQRDALKADLLKINTAHFGLTLIRASAFEKIGHPWFLGTPNQDGEWGEDHVDDDIHFWNRFEAAGLNLYLASRVPVGHIVEMVSWPDGNMAAMYQRPEDYMQVGKPAGVWQ